MLVFIWHTLDTFNHLTCLHLDLLIDMQLATPEEFSPDYGANLKLMAQKDFIQENGNFRHEVSVSGLLPTSSPLYATQMLLCVYNNATVILLQRHAKKICGQKLIGICLDYVPPYANRAAHHIYHVLSFGLSSSSCRSSCIVYISAYLCNLQKTLGVIG